jgi:hypothetical protein
MALFVILKAMNELVKIVVTVPEDEADDLRRAIGSAGGGKIGEYEYCSFSIKGKGRFKPTKDANPAIGEAGKLEEVTEERIEITCNKSDAQSIVGVIRKNHSYEEPAIDVYPLISFD